MCKLIAQLNYDKHSHTCTATITLHVHSVQTEWVTQMQIYAWNYHTFSVQIVIVTSTKEDVFSSLFVWLLSTLRKTSKRICMKFSGKVGNGPVNKWLNFGGSPDNCLDTGIVFRIRHYWEIRKVVNGHKSAAENRFARWQD